MSRSVAYRRLVGSKRWARMAYGMKTRAAWKCAHCGKVTQNLAVHHIVPVETGRSYEEMAQICFSASNCQVLCYECHAAAHRAMRTTLKSVASERQKEKVERFLKKYADKYENE